MQTISIQQRLYAEGRSQGMKKKEAAIHAGCSEKTASQQASRYEKNKAVIAHMHRLGFSPTGEPIELPEEMPPAKRQENQAKINAMISSKELKGVALDYLLQVVRDEEEDPKLRQDTAKYLAKYAQEEVKSKSALDKRKDAAGEAANRFGTSAPPKLKAVK